MGIGAVLAEFSQELEIKKTSIWSDPGGWGHLPEEDEVLDLGLVGLNVETLISNSWIQ